MATIKMQVIGNLGADATVNETSKRVSFSVAGDTYKEKTNWVTCFMSYEGETPTKLIDLLKKGACVSVIGRPSINTYEGKSYFNLNVHINNIDVLMLAKKKEAEEAKEAPEAEQQPEKKAKK